MCVLPSLTPIGEDVPDDAVVPLADDELESARVATACAARARKLDATSRDEGAEPQDLFVGQSAMGLPAAGRAHARDEISDRTDVFKLIGIAIFILKAKANDMIQVLFERLRPFKSVLKIKRRACPQQYCNYINCILRKVIN